MTADGGGREQIDWDAYRAAIDASPVGLGVLHRTGRILAVNPQFARIAGRSVQDLVGRSVVDDLCVADHAGRLRDGLERLRSGAQRTFVDSLQFERPDHSVAHVRCTGSAVAHGDGPVDVIILQIEDRSDVVEQERRYETIIAALDDPVGIIDEHSNWIWASPAFDRLGTPAEAGSVLGSNIHPEDKPLVDDAAGRILGGERSVSIRVRAWSHVYESWIWYDTTATDHRDDPAIGGVLVRCRNITEQVAAEDRLREQALHDPLTGLPNRVLLEDRIRTAAARSHRSDDPFAVLFVDLDGFKEINDSYGHAVGDLLLEGVALRLSDRLRGADTLARIGGDEFVVVATDLDLSQARHQVDTLCRSIRDAVDEPFVLERGITASISVSIGFVLSRGRREPDELLRLADMAMYRAKAAGKDRAVGQPGIDPPG